MWFLFMGNIQNRKRLLVAGGCGVCTHRLVTDVGLGCMAGSGGAVGLTHTALHGAPALVKACRDPQSAQ